MKGLFFSSIGLLTVLFVSSCSSDGQDGEKKSIDKEIVDKDAALNTNFDGKIFSIPSPIQTALLIKLVNAPFDETLLNPTENVSNYTDEQKQALNLGIYGTDLGYAAIYEQKSISMKYLSVVEKLTGELGLSKAFDKNFMSNFEKHADNQDSMMVVVSDAYKNADRYLKASNRKATSALILTGGWVESLYYACELNKMKSNKKLVDRIGEQKETLYTIIEILEEYNKEGSNNDLIQEMKDLKLYFDKVGVDYIFVQPTTDAKNKTTTLRHKIVYSIATDILNQISNKVESIRNKIIN
ncbi:MAG: hypothetical protein V4638_05375 [Bacteroidota bacterium]